MDKTVRVWNLEPYEYDGADWLALAQLTSGGRIDTTGALDLLTSEQFAEAWRQFSSRHPQEFTVTLEQTFAWHRREMSDCLRERNPAAALFHAWHASPEWHVLWAALVAPIR
jgi:hypothetical protein